MKYELRHHAHKPTLGGRSIPSDRTISELGDMAIHYSGTFSDYNPLHITDKILVYIEKEWTDKTAIMGHPINLKGLKFKNGSNYCGGGVSTNGGFKLNKNDLLRIANAMDETDTLQVSRIIQVEADFVDSFKEDISKIV